MKQKAFILVLCQLCFAFIMTQAFAAEVTLEWNPPKSGSVAGYNLYFGTGSRTYGEPLDVGNVLTCTVSGLSAETYYFAVTAYDSMDHESAYSNEVSLAGVTETGDFKHECVNRHFKYRHDILENGCALGFSG